MKRHQDSFKLLSSLLLCIFSLQIACNLLPATVEQGEELQATYPETLVTFQVTLPAPLQAGESVSLALLDEVTGLAFNQQLFSLQAIDSLHYSAILPFRIGSLLKYRYIRQGAYTVQEHLPNGLPIRYRLHQVMNQAVITDLVSRWTDTTYAGSTGRILGTITDSQTGKPIPNLLVTSAGMQTLTAADGAYLLEGLPAGTQNLIIYAQDGAYQTFEQGAVVAPEASTPANIQLKAASLVDVTFIVALPADTPAELPVRFAGNFLQLGNTFANLAGGVSTLAARMPMMQAMSDGRRSLTLTLPVGADLRYKYTTGDGIWNAEYTSEGHFNLRQLIVSPKAMTIEDQVTTWTTNGPAPVSFHVKTPSVMPPGDTVSIQFNPGYSWLEPLPMWPGADNTWSFTLYSPLQGMETLQYRYCRNEQCSSADDIATSGPLAQGRIINLTSEAQVVNDTITGWSWLPEITGPTTVPNISIPVRPQGFLVGVALQSAYHPSWTPHFPQAVRYLKEMNTEWLLFAPTWTYLRTGSPLLELDPRQDIPWNDLLVDVQTARQEGLNVGLYPQLHFTRSAAEWWPAASRDYPWWVTWFDRYRSFVLHHAQLANSNGAGVLILGGRDLLPAIPGGKLPDGSPTNLPADAEKWWRALLQDIRAVYPGPVAWALPYPQGFEALPPFLDQVDFIYVEWSAPLATDVNVTEDELHTRAGGLLDQALLPLQAQTQKALVLAISYPSASGGITGCLLASEGNCVEMNALDRPNPDLPQIPLDLDAQTRAYNAMLLAVNDRPWIGGFISQDFYPAAMLQDKSASVYGKPAAGALWYWYARFLNK